MPDLASRTPRVAVYIDFDNVVISRYDQVHGGRRDAWRADDVRRHSGDPDSVVGQKLQAAHVDVGALIDYAASYGRVAVARAYADWSVPVNASYQRQLVDRAVDLTQLFPVSGTKNGADIRLAVDTIDDLMRYEDITHVVLVAGDSDYIALAQRCKQLGRYVVGIGVSGSTSRALVASCDEFTSYDDVPGVQAPVVAVAATTAPAAVAAAAPGVGAAAAPEPDRSPLAATFSAAVVPPAADAVAAAPTRKATAKKTATKAVTKKATTKKAAAAAEQAAAEAAAVVQEPPPATGAARKTAAKRTAKKAATKTAAPDAEPDPAAAADDAHEAARQREATALLVRALRVARDRADTAEEWLHGGGVKSQMQRMDGSFKEKALGYRTFSAFVESRDDVVESYTEPGDGHLRLRLRS